MKGRLLMNHCPECQGRDYENCRLLAVLDDGSNVFGCENCLISFDEKGHILKRLTEKQALRMARMEEFVPERFKER